MSHKETQQDTLEHEPKETGIVQFEVDLPSVMEASDPRALRVQERWARTGSIAVRARDVALQDLLG